MVNSVQRGVVNSGVAVGHTVVFSRGGNHGGNGVGGVGVDVVVCLPGCVAGGVGGDRDFY